MLDDDGGQPQDRLPLPAIFSPLEWGRVVEHLRLSRRQAEVARLICRGLRKAEIARQLTLTEYTIRMHANALYRRLKVHDRVGVVVRLVLVARRVKRGKGREDAP